MERIRLFSERERAEDGKRRGRSGSGVAEGAYCGQRVKQRQEDQQANPSHLTGLPTGEHRQKNGLDYGQSEPGTEWALCASIDFAFVNRLRLTTSRDKESEQEKAKQLRVNGKQSCTRAFWDWVVHGVSPAIGQFFLGFHYISIYQTPWFPQWLQDVFVFVLNYSQLFLIRS